MYLKSILLIVANLGLVGLFIYLLRKPGRLSYYLNGRGWLTWLSVAVIHPDGQAHLGVLRPRRGLPLRRGQRSHRYCLGPDLIWRTFHEHRFLN